MSSTSLLMVLVVLDSLHSFKTALSTNEPNECCFTYQRKKLPTRFITDYRETRRGCRKPAIIFIMKSGRRVCAEPRVQWVKQHMDAVDQHHLASLSPHDANTPDSCCVTFQGKIPPLRLITDYRETEPHCTKPGIIFILKSRRLYCADPGVQWVKERVEEIEQHHLESLTKPKAHDAERPEPCCFLFHNNEIPVHDISVYRKTNSNCTTDGILFILKDGSHVCADPEDQWVKEQINTTDHQHVTILTKSQDLSGVVKPELCCFTFQRNETPVQDISVYRKTHSDCSTAGILFILKDGSSVCADPKEQWVKEHMNTIDLIDVTKLMQSQKLSVGTTPGLCCFTFQMKKIAPHLITEYRETHSSCQKSGIIFILKNGHHVCADPGALWVTKHKDKFNKS